MFGKKSKEKKEEKKAENIEVESLHGFNVKEIKNAKQISQEESFKRNLKEKAERIEAEEKAVAAEAAKRKATAKSETIAKAERLEAEEKMKADYIDKKSKLTTEELLAEILMIYEDKQSLKKVTSKEKQNKHDGEIATQEEALTDITKNQYDILMELKNISRILEIMNKNVDAGLGMPSTVKKKSILEDWGS
jgi:hypothetical protein